MLRSQLGGRIKSGHGDPRGERARRKARSERHVYARSLCSPHRHLTPIFRSLIPAASSGCILLPSSTAHPAGRRRSVGWTRRVGRWSHHPGSSLRVAGRRCRNEADLVSSSHSDPTPFPPSRPTVPKIPSRRVALGVSITPNRSEAPSALRPWASYCPTAGQTPRSLGRRVLLLACTSP